MDELTNVFRDISESLRDKLDDRELLVRLDEKLTGLVTEVRHSNSETRAVGTDHESRIRHLEARINWLWGALGISTAGAVAIAKFL